MPTIMGLNGLVLVLLVVPLCSAQTLNFRDNIKSDLAECTNDNLIRGIAECFVDKFEDLIPAPFTDASLFDSDDHFNSGRKPLSMRDEIKDSASRNNYVIPQISKHLSATHKKLLDAIWVAGHAALKKEHEVMAYEKLRHINLQELIYEYIVNIMEHTISPTILKLSRASRFAHESQNGGKKQTTQNSFCENLPPCRLPRPGPLCDLCYALTTPLQCLAEFNETDFEDGVKWIKCFYNCEDLRPIGSCLQTHFAQCGAWSIVGDIILKGFASFTELDSCMIKVVSDRNLTLVEGGSSEVVTFYNYMPPSVHCVDLAGLSAPLGVIGALGTMLGVMMGDSPNCTVEIQMSLQNYWHDLMPHIDGMVGRPKCHQRNLQESRALRQAVLGYHDYNNNTAETCVVLLTNDNWNKTFEVPVWASIDSKHDGDVWTDFTMKMVINRRTVYTDKLQAHVVDTDVASSTLCFSSGDPHITTFDGHYYNNMYEGFFYLYKNTFLPYEVQVIYQRCDSTTNATCTCAVAVKSGDDVFVVDRCRRQGDAPGNTVMRAVMFTNGRVTPGTRVFNKNKGAEMQVLLPIGTTVTIVTSNSALSVFVNPSSYDLQQTGGLCGYFDGDWSNDLMMTDGSVYNGTGSELRGQPNGFSQDWRVPESDIIFEGSAVEQEPDNIGRYCLCNHVVFLGVQCECGPGELVETCDMDLEGEITDVLAAISKKSRKSNDVESNIGMGDIDVDVTRPAPDMSWRAGAVWNQTAAESYCADLISSASYNALVQGCATQYGEAFLHQARWHCTEDIMMTDSLTWQYSAVEAAKRMCSAYFLRGIDLDGAVWEQYENSSCLNDCSNNGVCRNGTCECDGGWMGGDCSLATQPAVVVMDDSTMCDTRHEDCAYATIYGKNFAPTQSIYCQLRPAHRRSDGTFEVKGDTMTSEEVIYISPYQVVCRLPNAQSYDVTLLYNNQPLSVATSASPETYATSFIFMVYDSACYTCSLDQEKCVLKDRQTHDYCLISSDCFALGQHNPEDDCRYCNSTEEYDDWTWYTDEVCTEEQEAYITELDRAQREKIIRISVAVILTLLIVILTIVLYCLKKKTHEEGLNSMGEKKGDDGIAEKGYTNTSMQMEELGGYSNLKNPQVEKVKDLENGGKGVTGHESRTSSVCSIGSAKDLDEARRAAKEKRKNQSRTESITSTTSSVRSIGLGGGGPVQYSHYNTVGEGEHYEHVKGMGGHGSPALPTRSNSHKGINVNVAY